MYGIGYWGIYKRRARRAAAYAKEVREGTRQLPPQEYIEIPSGVPVWRGPSIAQNRRSAVEDSVARAILYTDPRVASRSLSRYTTPMAVYSVSGRGCGLPAPVPAGYGVGGAKEPAMGYGAGFPRWNEPRPHRYWAENDDTAWAARARYAAQLERQGDRMRYSTGHPISQQDARAMQHVLREHGYSAGARHQQPISMTNYPWVGESVWGAWGRNRRQNYHDTHKAQEQRRWGRNWGGGYGVGYMHTGGYPHGLCLNNVWRSPQYLSQAGGPWRVARNRWDYYLAGPAMQRRC